MGQRFIQGGGTILVCCIRAGGLRVYHHLDHYLINTVCPTVLSVEALFMYLRFCVWVTCIESGLTDDDDLDHIKRSFANLFGVRDTI
jgi:hypothetical protein